MHTRKKYLQKKKNAEMKEKKQKSLMLWQALVFAIVDQHLF